jgi:hypothetical protein
MISNGLFSQIAVLVLSVGIIFTYIKPTFEEITVNQDQISTYQGELKKVEEVDSTLKALSASISNISATDKHRLLTYMPDTIDTIAIPRTIEAIAHQVGISPEQITHEGEAPESSRYVELGTLEVKPVAEFFSVEVRCTYEQLKAFLRLLEQNEFPLEVTELQVTPEEGGFLTASLILTTYRHQLSGQGDTIE